MFTYTFLPNGIPLYEQLYRFIKQDIEQGHISAEEKLPSKRVLARHLGISVMTVETAYQQLVAEGYVQAVAKTGFFANQLNLPQKQYIKSELSILNSSDLATKNQKWRVDLTNHQTSVDSFPFSVWAKLVRELLHTHQKELMERAESGGVMALRCAIASHLQAFRGMSVNPEQIIVGAGMEYLYGLLIQLLGLNKRYAVADPSYDKLRKIYASYGVPTTTISMQYLTAELNAANVEVLHTSPSHHFPTGQVMPITRRYELLGWAAEQSDRYIIEDDYDSEFRFVGQPIPALQSIDMLGKVIYMNTFSKTLASTVRIAYMVLPPELLARFKQQLSFYSSTVSNFEQYVLADFIRQGYFEKHINRMRTYYQRKRDQLLSALKTSKLAEKMTITEENSGLHFIVKFDTQLSDTAILNRAAANGLRFTALSEYYLTPTTAPKNTFVMGYSNLDDKQIAYAVACLEEIIGKN